MDFFYQIGIFLYSLVTRLAAPFHHKARLLVTGQQSAFPYLVKTIDHSRPIIWVHAASLGEFEQGRPLIEEIKKSQPEYQILLTFFSPSGYEIRKNYDGADYICYLPVDSRRNARKFIELVKPEVVFFIKYEFWFNYFSFLKEKEIPLYLVSAIFRGEQLFFKSSCRGKWYQKILRLVAHFFVQNEQSANLLKEIGINNCTITGDTRFDRVAEIAANRKELPLVKQFKNDQKLIVVGSSWEPDEKLLVSVMKNHTSAKFIFAPHEVREPNIRRLEILVGGQAIRYSQAGKKDIAKVRILIIDSIGLLSSIYQYADIAYIGGGFGVGIHNTLEAAIYNIPVLFGPNYEKFHEAIDLINHGIAFPVHNEDDLVQALNDLLDDDENCRSISEKCRFFMQKNVGATQIILQKVLNN